MSHNCAEVALDIKTYYAGKNQATHPNVISFDKKWNGYYYWMAYTTYPYADGSEENPCIAASNDLIHWEKPDGLINPVACCEETECDELKDTHLMYNSKTNLLELWYLGRIQSSIIEHGPLYCFRKTSKDGIHWSKYEIMFKFNEMNLASETVMYLNDEQNNKIDSGYHFWGFRNDNTDIGLYYMFSKNGINWTKLEKCNVPQDKETSMWHGAVTYVNGIYYLVWVGKGEFLNKIYIASSNDGIKYNNTSVMITNDTGWKHLYRPALTICDKGIYCYYGVVRDDDKWMLGLSYGSAIDSLSGITLEQVPDIDNQRISSTKKIKISKLKKNLSSLFIPRMVACFIPVLAVEFLTKSVIISFVFAVLLCILWYYVKYYRNRALTGGILMGFICSMLSTFMFEITNEITKWIL